MPDLGKDQKDQNTRSEYSTGGSPSDKDVGQCRTVPYKFKLEE